MSSLKFITPLIKYRLFWYQKKIFEKLIRFKHGLILLIAFFVPTAGFLSTLITQPILSVVHPASASYVYFLNIVTIQLIYLGWILFQRDAVYLNVIKDYFQSLPIEKWINRFVDILVIIVANNLFWIPFIVTLCMTSHIASADKSLFLLRLISVIVSIIAIQIAWFDKKIVAILMLGLVDLLLYLNITFSSIIIPILAIAISIFSVLFIDLIRIENGFLPSILRFSFKFFNADLMKWFPLLAPQFATLWRKYRVDLITRFIITLSIMALGYGLLVLGGNFQPQQISIIVASGIILILSGVYPLLKETRDACSLYFKSLPLNDLNWYAIDYFVLVIMTTILMSFYMLLIFVKHKLTIISISYSIITILSMGFLLLYTRNLFPKQGTLISTIVVMTCTVFLEWYLK